MSSPWKAWLHAPLAALLLAACVQNTMAPVEGPSVEEALRASLQRALGGPDEDDEFEEEEDGFWPVVPER